MRRCVASLTKARNNFVVMSPTLYAQTKSGSILKINMTEDQSFFIDIDAKIKNACKESDDSLNPNEYVFVLLTKEQKDNVLQTPTEERVDVLDYIINKETLIGVSAAVGGLWFLGYLVRSINFG